MNYKQNYIFYHPFLEQIFDKFPLLKEQIIFYFTSLYAEKDRCIRAPYRMIGDMTLMYGILWKNEKGEDCLIPVTCEHLNLWKKQEEELFAAARENTPRLLPVCLRPMGEFLRDFLSTEEKRVMEEEIYVLTNSRGYLGAAAMLYEGVLERFSARVGADLYILPSSIHEVILLPFQGQKKEFLQENGVESAIIDLGGNVLCISGRPDGTPFRIGVRRPFSDASDSMVILEVDGRSVVTSGVYERYFEEDGVLYHHLLDPETGYPCDSGLLSVTILSDSSAEGDALSTACFVLGLEKGMELAVSAGVEAIFIDENYELHFTPGFSTPYTLPE